MGRPWTQEQKDKLKATLAKKKRLSLQLKKSLPLLRILGERINKPRSKKRLKRIKEVQNLEHKDKPKAIAVGPLYSVQNSVNILATELGSFSLAQIKNLHRNDVVGLREAVKALSSLVDVLENNAVESL